MNNVIAYLKKRKFLDQLSFENLEEVFQTPQSIYVGFDATADSLHLGNLVGIIALRWFQKFGHNPVVLLGGATTKIGDPSGKSQERPLLEDALIDKNLQSIKRLFSKYLSSEENPFSIFNNMDWIGKFSLLDFLRDVGKHFRLSQMLAKESVKLRLQSEEGISFTEFTYQMLQAYDFYHLEKNHQVVAQVGGSDQWGNITAGIELARKLSQKQVYGMTFPLLVRSDGKKFGKSEQGAIWLDGAKCSAYDLYQYLYKVPDKDCINMLRLLTFLPNEEIERLEEEQKQCKLETNFLQGLLAKEVTTFVHGKEGLDEALQATQALRPGQKVELDHSLFEQLKGSDLSVQLSFDEVVGKRYTDLCVLLKLTPSKGEIHRLIQNQGAYLNQEKVTSTQLVIEKKDLIDGRYLLISLGKKKKMVVEILKK